MVRFLDWQGFAEVRIRSHHVMQRGTAHTTVPVHGSKKLRIGTLRGTFAISI
jgi:predicted RNA binding protein YcfA (HicA-like mRNA interferase family)